jgi:hypothetical protein
MQAVNLCVGNPPNENAFEALSDEEKQGMARFQEYSTLGNAYARAHGSRPATIGFVLCSSPIAQLAWLVQGASSSSQFASSQFANRLQDRREVHPVVLLGATNR